MVGGTGMLRGVCRWLAGRGEAVSVIARRRGPLDVLARESSVGPGSVHGIPLDYTDDGALRAGLEAAVRERGPAALAVCWIHSTAPRAVDTVAQCLAPWSDTVRRLRLLQLRGSAAADPSSPRREVGERLRRLHGVRLEVVLLGYAWEESRTRWLTDDEIVDGVIQAIRNPRDVHEVGILRPWSDRP